MNAVGSKRRVFRLNPDHAKTAAEDGQAIVLQEDVVDLLFPSQAGIGRDVVDVGDARTIKQVDVAAP